MECGQQGQGHIVQVRLVIEEKEIEVAPGASVWAFTFNGSVPGPLIVAHEGDYIELTLVNCRRRLNTDPPCRLNFDPGAGVAV